MTKYDYDNTHACYCIGPQPGHTLCPCMESRDPNRSVDPSYYVYTEWEELKKSLQKGCICPPGSEQTCLRWDCGRKTVGIGPAKS